MDSTTSSGDLFNLCFMWSGLVDIKVWILNLLANFNASWHASISFFICLDNPAGIEFFKILLTSVTASKSPGEAIGNPASIISTPSSSKTLAIWIFSSRLIDAPGDCSPSRIVVSNMYTLFLSDILAFFLQIIVQSLSENVK